MLRQVGWPRRGVEMANVFSQDTHHTQAKCSTISSLAAHRLVLAALLACVAGTALPHPSWAQPTANSSAFGELVDLTLLPLVGGGVDVDSGPLPTASGIGSLGYDQTNQLVSVTVSKAPLGTILQSGVLTAHAASSLPGTTAATADATVDDLAVTLAGSAPLLTLIADAVESTATVSGTCGGPLTAVGTTTIVAG